MATFQGNPVTQRGGADAGRGDDPHGVTSVNRFSATTRKAAPVTKEEYHDSISKGIAPPVANGSQTSYSVTNSGGLGKGEGMSMVRSKYRESRQAGMSPDDARGAALNPLSYPAATGPGGNQGPDIKMTTDAYGNRI